MRTASTRAALAWPRFSAPSVRRRRIGRIAIGLRRGLGRSGGSRGSEVGLPPGEDIGSMRMHMVCTRVQTDAERLQMQDAMKSSLPNSSLAHAAAGAGH
jgi:hypothetical protein